MQKKSNWEQFESEKKQLISKKLSPAVFEREVKKLLRRLRL